MLFMATNSPNPLWFVLGGLAVAGGVCAGWYILKRIRKPEPPEPDGDQPEPIVDPLSPFVDRPTAVVEQAKLMITYFSGSMNSLADIAKDGDKDEAAVVFENLSQTIEAHGSDELKKWFFDFANDRKSWDEALCKEKAKEMFDILKACGLQQSTEKRLKWDKIAEEHYRKLEKIEYGEICEAVAPCWIYNHKVFEKGLVKKVSN